MRSAGPGAAGSGEAAADGAAPSPSARRDATGRAGEPDAPCLRCGVSLPVRLMGCKGGHCPNCGHPYPHGDCSD